MRESEPSALGLVLVVLAGLVMVGWIAMARPTPEERANMWDKLQTKTNHSTEVNWR